MRRETRKTMTRKKREERTVTQMSLTILTKIMMCKAETKNYQGKRKPILGVPRILCLGV